jgi:glycosyltransferase involved in cell wall biosynthesis
MTGLRTPCGGRSLLLVATVAETVNAFLLPIARFMKAAGWRVFAATNGASRELGKLGLFDALWDISWERSPRHIIKLWKSSREIWRAVRESDARVVHVHTPIAAFVSRLALDRLRRRGLRVVYTAHGFHFHAYGRLLTNVLYRSMEKIASRWTDRLVVINREDHAAALRYRFLPPQYLQYMPGIGIDLAEYDPEKVSALDVQRARQELGLASSDKLVVVVGALNKEKRPLDAVAAFALASEPDLHLAFLGRGPLARAVSEFARSLGVAGKVHLLGYRTDVRPVIRAASCTMLLSQREGLPRSILESMALGVPVIGARIRGVEELLGNGAGVLVPVQGVPEAALAIKRIVKDGGFALSLASAGQKAVVKFRQEGVLEMHRQLYEGLL